MTNVVVCCLVPDVSELGWDGVRGAYRGVVLSFVVWVPRRCWQRGTWFLLVGAGGFHGGGSRFCACGHLFMFILGHMLLFGQSDDDERWIQICCSSCDRHVAVSDMAPGMCVSKEKVITYCAW